MNKRKLERVVVMLLSIAMLISSTGILSSLAANAGETASAPSSSVSETSTSTESAQKAEEVSVPDVTEEGGALVVDEKGDGTVEHPYEIANADDFLKMSEKINITTNSNKNFVLISDIDLSGVTEDNLKKNGGSLVSADKNLAKQSANVFFILDGKGHTVKGLNLSVKSSAITAIFGFVSEKSVISNIKIDKPVIKSASESSAAVLAAENKGTIKNVEITYPVFSAKAEYAGLVAAVNDGTIINVTVRSNQTSSSAATADTYTISGNGTIGAVAGLNRGTISNVSATSIGMYIPANDTVNTVYGGIAGQSAGQISNSVSTGNVCGGKASDAAGGMVGKALDGLKLTNNYVLVSIANSVNGCAVIGSAGKADMLSECYWSSSVSGRALPAADTANDKNNVITDLFRIITVGSTAKITAADAKNVTWGKAIFNLNGAYKTKNANITANADATELTVKGEKADEISTVIYSANITLPATVGAGSDSVTIKQNMRIHVLTVSDETVGSGTKENPLVITTYVQFSFLSCAPAINCKLGKDIVIGGKVIPFFCGTLDGCGHTVTVDKQLFTNVSGTVKNLYIAVNKDTTVPVFSKVIGAQMSGVSVYHKDGVKLTANNGNNAVFAGRIIGGSFDDCRVQGNIVANSDNIYNIGGFAGCIAGNGTTVRNSGAVVNISEKDGKQLKSTANFAGDVSAENAVFENCYVGGKNSAGKFTFIDSVNTKKITVNNVYAEKGSAAKAVDFNAYKDIIKENQFSDWTFDDGEYGFFTGNNGKFAVTLPNVRAISNSSSADFKANYDASKVTASVTVEKGKAVLSVTRAEGVVTVKSLPITVTNTKTGLSSTMYISNGLEKDGNGNWLVSSAYDLAYIGENIKELSDSSFVVNKDIDMSEIKNFASIGSTSTAFSGKFDGAGHVISNLTINGTAKTALFGTLSNATVKNIKFVNAKVNSEGGFAAVLAGQARGNTVVSNITVENSAVTVNNNYAGAVIASTSNSTGIKISDITVKNSSVKSSASNIGAVAGFICDNTSVSNVAVENFTASGSHNVSGVVGLMQGGANVVINGAKVNGADISGISSISGIATCVDSGTSISNAEVYGSKIYTNGTDASSCAGGITASASAKVENVKVDSTVITAGVAGGIVGKASNGCALQIKNASVSKSVISASDANTVAAGILAAHKANGSATITNCVVSEDTTISGAAICSAVVGDFNGAESTLRIDGVKALAAVNGCETANAIAAAGIIGRVGAASVNGLAVNNAKAGGSVSGAGSLGGAFGIVKYGDKYDGKNAMLSNSVVFTEIKPFDEKTNAGLVIGSADNKKTFADNDLNKAISNVVISTFGQVSAYSAESGLAGGKISDMDKPNGKAITSSVPVLNTNAETAVTISNLPSVKGYSFDSKTGWLSESDERVQVVSSTESSAVLKANHMADLSIVGYYVLDSDPQVRIPVHFNIISDIRTPLKGSGTKADPYLVSCAYDLETVTRYSNEDAFFALTDDIVFTPDDFKFGGAFYNVGNGVVTIGDAANGFKGTFTGLYGGKVHSISGLAVAGNAFGGLFGAADGATISELVIKNAKISGLNYAAVIAGSAKDTVIRNITIENAAVETLESGSFAGAVAGYAENTAIENVKINNVTVKTAAETTGATVEIAGGAAGVFSGSISNVQINNAVVESGTLAGGFIGEVRDGEAKIASSKADVQVNSETAGGAVGRIENPLKFAVKNCLIGGAVNGTKNSAGVIGEILSSDSSARLTRLEVPLVSDTVITAKISDAENSGIVIGSADAVVVPDTDNSKTDVFDKVYYSSYQNAIGAFGTEEMNAYQTSEYAVTDLSDITYVSNGKEAAGIPLGTEYLVLSSDSLKLNGADGTFKSFAAGSEKFVLETIKSDVEGAIAYDAAASAIKLNSAENSDVKAVLVYNDGLELAVDVALADVLRGNGTKESPYEINSTDEFVTALQNADGKDVYYVLKSDISLKGVESIELFAGNLDGAGHVLYDFTGSGLFGKVTGTIRNTGFVGFEISDDKAVALGAVAGVIDGGQILDSYVVADVNAGKSTQDTGILAGRLQNGAAVSNVLTSGKVLGNKSMAAGGVAGSADSSKISGVTSTAYVNGGNAVGGILGEAKASVLDKVIFGGMVDAADGKCGNIIGINSASKVTDAYFDSQTSRADSALGSGDDISAAALPTEKLCELKLGGFTAENGYPVPENIAGVTDSKFAAGAAFAAMKICYLAGLNAGTVYNYTGVNVDKTVNGNDVELNTTDGITLTLVPTADYAGTENAIERFANPLSIKAVNISCNLVDETNGKLGDKLVDVLLKSKVDETSYSFDFFTKASAEAKAIGSVVATDGGFYVNAEGPAGVKYSVNAVDENGKTLTVSDAKSEGYFVATGTAKTIVISIIAENETEDIWGLRSIWGVTGK